MILKNTSFVSIGLFWIGVGAILAEGREKIALPVGRSAHAAIALGEEIYVISGYSEKQFLKRVDVLNTKTKGWVQVAPVQWPRCFFAAAKIEGKLYLLGGMRKGDSGKTETVKQVECYDPQRNCWEHITDWPEPRNRVCAVVLDKRIYVFGGYNPGKREEGGGDFPDVDIYDTETGKWSKGPELPKACHGCSAVVINGRIHVLWMQHHWVLEQGRWKALQKPPLPVLFASTEVVAGKLYLLGGRSSSSKLFVYDAAADRWGVCADLPKPLNRFASAVVNGRIYTLGGEGMGRGDHYSSRVEIYHPAEDSWQ